MLTVLVTIVHVIVCVFLIIVVLLQSSQSADISAAFGGAGSQTTFGPRGTATILSKATTWSAIIFMITSFWLSVLAFRSPSSGSVFSGTKTTTTQPAAPANQPAAPKK